MQKGELHMGKQDEFLWDETPMGEKVEEEVAEFLRKRNPRYMQIKAAQKEILEEYPAILRIFYAEEEEVNLTVTEHRKLIEHLDLEDRAERMKRKYCFFLRTGSNVFLWKNADGNSRYCKEKRYRR